MATIFKALKGWTQEEQLIPALIHGNCGILSQGSQFFQLQDKNIHVDSLIPDDKIALEKEHVFRIINISSNYYLLQKVHAESLIRFVNLRLFKAIIDI